MDNVDFSKDIRDYSGLELAFLGDAIWELEIRKYYLQFGYNIPTLNRYVKSKVNAKLYMHVLKEALGNIREL